MKLSSKAKNIFTQIHEGTKLGEIRKIAKTIKKDHSLAMELWSTAHFYARQMAILIMDKKRLNEEVMDQLIVAMDKHPEKEKLQLMDWLMANQLMKDKNTIALMESWEGSESALKRRTFWYYQGRLRWVGQTPPPNTQNLLNSIEKRILTEEPQVQWAMNFTAAQIGIFIPELRSRCIAIGERTGLYKDEIVAKNCTPNYLPTYIKIQVDKLRK